ncbi:hypothetical protein SODALDRAFT_319919 [Sodiomyces alkalinus F11]|uniref:Uncharacterized protein n=1 Tax=Sodiomyces alkalinus (strain CBS 110278 / VKM F-3762 / F11) TaxID=1314773 RepID=A0A3N2Q9Q3_SODAK|nr:hypothetical protein SODALDRAFT_319919 [Sodiomyces alkalinus F11]ROT43466.1 hypothetical protein SODALDRAFT_319919 [Sodiomyces alkalinus F11]
MPSDKHDRSSHRKSPGRSSSPRAHHRKTSDSALGSLSDQDSFASNPDRSFTPQDYSELSKDPYALAEALKAAEYELSTWKKKCKELEAELQNARSEYRGLDATYRAQIDRNSVLEDENKILSGENIRLRNKNEDLRDEMRRIRNSPPRERELPAEMTGALGPDSRPSSSSKDANASRHHRERERERESKKEKEKEKEREKKEREKKEREKRDREEKEREQRHREEKEREQRYREEKEREQRYREEKEREQRHREDKERLRSRFDVDGKGPVSSHSAHSDHSARSVQSGHSAHSGRSRRGSYLEPFGPGGRPPSHSHPAPASQPSSSGSHPPSASRKYNTYAPSRPVMVSTLVTPAYSDIPRTSQVPPPYSPDLNEPVFADDPIQAADYYSHPLPSDKPHRSRR